MASGGASQWEGQLSARAAAALAEFQAQQPASSDVAVSKAQLAGMIDHTLLKAEATPAMIVRHCAEAREYRFASVCVNPCYVPLCVEQLADSNVVVCTVAGFPLGAAESEVKAFEARRALGNGAREIDMVLNVGALKAGHCALVRDDIRAVCDVCHAQGARLKVIFETCLLSDAEKVTACLIACEVGVDFVKTSTGLNASGATVEDVALMRAVVGAQMGVKAAGGIRDYAGALAMVRAGANRLGSSAGVKILQSMA